ncbi:MAG: hypothetical protein P4L69_17910 [Desulfosporosinus sp.]|nr:hypothetical protein [Desulfosporosinus sp.]
MSGCLTPGRARPWFALRAWRVWCLDFFSVVARYVAGPSRLWQGLLNGKPHSDSGVSMRNMTKMKASMLLAASIIVVYSILFTIELRTMNIIASISALAMFIFVAIHRYVGNKVYPQSNDYEVMIDKIDLCTASRWNIIFFTSLNAVYITVGLLIGEVVLWAMSISVNGIVIR